MHTIGQSLKHVGLQEYEVKDNRSTVAVTAGDKAFIFWRVNSYILAPLELLCWGSLSVTSVQREGKCIIQVLYMLLWLLNFAAVSVIACISRCVALSLWQHQWDCKS